MIRAVVSRDRALEAGFEPIFWVKLYEDGVQRGELATSGEIAAVVVQGLRGAGVNVVDLTADEDEEEIQAV